MKKYRYLVVLLWSLFTVTTTLEALTVTKTYSGPTVEIDNSGEYGVSLQPLDFTSADFYTGAVVSQVTISIDWTKTDGTCSTQLSGPAYHGETSFRVDGPIGSTILAPTDTWSGNTDIGDVTTVFDQTASAAPSGTPVDGTFKPNGGDLNSYMGKDPVGSWRLSAGDNANNDTLCVHAYSVSITVVNDIDTDGDGVGNAHDVDDDNDGILDSFERNASLISESNVTTGAINDNSCFDRNFTIAQSGIIADSIMLDIQIDHTYRADLDINLLSPQGTLVDITSDNGGSVNNLYVLFDDAATTSVVGDSSTQPPQQTLSPEQAFSNFNGEDFQGTWTLHICDDAGNDEGTFNEVTLVIDYKGIDIDTDNDGVLDQYDLDSDNDGIPDNVEAQATDPQQTPGYVAPSYNVNANGFQDDVYASGLIPPDTDGDGIADYIDSDSDNDSETDCLEGLLGNSVNGTKACPVASNANVGINGMIDWAETVDDYTDVNGMIDSDPTTKLFNYISATTEVSYREISACGNIVWELTTNQWKTISAPCRITENTSSTALAQVADIFANLGTQCLTDSLTETCDWTMYVQNQNDYSGNRNTGYHRMDPADKMYPGVGYWIITSETDPQLLKYPLNQNTLGQIAVTNQTVDRHSVVRSEIVGVYRKPGSITTSSLVSKVFLGNPFAGQLRVMDIFATSDAAAGTFYPFDDTANISPFINQIVYTYDAAGTDITQYQAIPANGTPGFTDIVEVGIGFWIGVKANTNASVGIDFPYYKK